MAWQAQVRDMEKSFIDATTTLAAARRRGKGRDTTTELGAGLKQDYAQMLKDTSDTQSKPAPANTIVAEGGEEYISIDSGDAVGNDDAESAYSREFTNGLAEHPGDVGLGDFGPDLGDDVEMPTMRKMTPIAQTEQSLLVRVLAMTRNIGIIGAAVLFGLFIVGVGMVVWEEMQADAGADEFRPNVAIDGTFVDSKTIAQEAAMRGESAKDAMLDVEKEMRG